MLLYLAHDGPRLTRPRHETHFAKLEEFDTNAYPWRGRPIAVRPFGSVFTVDC